ncbi:probable methyltransferase-like protein 24 [Argopecten irradians]|uniref:probable methyltransferase-like protein 24 n=1 Tax=Argopecten irradians TaxID=31199 RepID=UPI00371BE66E
MSKSFTSSLIRYRSRNVRLWMLIALIIGAIYIISPFQIYSGVASPRPTPFNRTWWDAKSLPEKLPYTMCHTPVALKQNISVIDSIKKTIAIPEGPPPEWDELCRMSFEDLEMYYHTYLSTIQLPCKRSLRMGNTLDGGWDVCSEKNKINRNACLVYSFGIQFDFSFDDDIASVFGCEVHSFDPSMHQKDHNRSPSVFFHAIGLSDYNGVSKDMASWKMRTFKTIRKELLHESRATEIIKMDIESWEWQVIPDMLKTSQFTGTKQLLVEFHANTDTHVREYWIHKLLILRELYLEGFRIFWIGRNMKCTYTSPILKRKLYGCYEVSFVKNS